MRRAFLAGCLGLLGFEALAVYFIMPFPGSQRIPSLAAAYLLYQWRWPVRALCALTALAGLPDAWRRRSWRLGFVPALLLVVAASAFAVNGVLAADAQFKQPTVVRMVPVAGNTVAMDRLVVDGAVESFRLVGMDQFNAMLEDATTGSWWRQANGEAVTGPRKGTRLEELPSRQVTLGRWLALHPDSRIMQADTIFLEEYAKDYAYERGTSRKQLTGTDTASWREKSWVVGITIGGASTAFDWNRLERERVINATVGGTPIVLALASDSASFFAFERPDPATLFALRGDSLVTDSSSFAFNGRGPSGALRAINASQEFWHSWRTFQPATARY